MGDACEKLIAQVPQRISRRSVPVWPHNCLLARSLDIFPTEQIAWVIVEQFRSGKGTASTYCAFCGRYKLVPSSAWFRCTKHQCCHRRRFCRPQFDVPYIRNASVPPPPRLALRIDIKPFPLRRCGRAMLGLMLSSSICRSSYTASSTCNTKSRTLPHSNALCWPPVESRVTWRALKLLFY